MNKEKYTFNIKQKGFLLKYLRENKTISDLDCAKKIVTNKLFKDWGKKEDSLRRYITFIRDWEYLKIKTPKVELTKEIQRLIKQYPNSSVMGLAVKMNVKYPEFKVGTLKYYISNYINYGVI